MNRLVKAGWLFAAMVATPIVVAQEAPSATSVASSATGMTREQVRLELLEARRSGRLPANDWEEDRLWRESARGGRSRAEVVAEMRQARERNNLPRNEWEEDRMWAQSHRSTMPREQVLAEAIEARRLGLFGQGEVGVPVATPQQVEQIRLAGLRAVQRVAGRTETVTAVR